jgi:hypothetical protein
MNVKAVALNHLIEDQTSFFRPEGIEFDSVPNSLGARGNRCHRRPSAGARIENADSVPVSGERQETPNSFCFFL